MKTKYKLDIMKKANALGAYAFQAKATNKYFGTNAGYTDMCEMIRLAETHNKIQEHGCNGTKTRRMEDQELVIQVLIESLAAKLGLRAEFTGDPRGYTVKLHAPNGKLYNTWGGNTSGYGI